MRIEQYLDTLPTDIMNGNDVILPPQVTRDILEFGELQSGETFCHLGCGKGDVLKAAAKYGAKLYGIEHDESRANASKHLLGTDANIICDDITSCSIPNADLFLFWFTDPKITHIMSGRIAAMSANTRIITIWGPLPGYLPHKVKFPYILSRTPLPEAADMREQIKAVFGVDCISYGTAWEYAERYTKAIQPANSQNDRFLTILQALSIWCSARALGVCCESEIPTPVRTYVGVMRNYFGIEFEHLL